MVSSESTIPVGRNSPLYRVACKKGREGTLGVTRHVASRISYPLHATAEESLFSNQTLCGTGVELVQNIPSLR